MDYGTAADAELPGDPGIVQEATERWKACKDFQGTEDERTRDDIKFANADTRNAWQWPEKIYAQRTGGEVELPCLTINNVRVHNDLIINSMSKNAFGIKIRPTAGKASYESAKVMQSCIKRIQNQSAFPSQRRKVAEQQVDGGIGYIIIETRYVSERSFNQDIYLKASRDPTGVYLDPWIREPDGSDAGFGLIFDLMPRKEFNRKYPKWKNKVGANPIGTAFADWLSDKTIMLCKYYRKKDKSDTLVSYKVDDGDEVEKLKSEIVADSGKEIYDALLADIDAGKIDGKTRKVTNNEVEWFLIAGDTIIDRGDWIGKYIPICRCVGRELVIDNTLDRKGHTRPMIDAQRMLNYNASSSVQVVAFQVKTQWLSPARAVEGQEQWKTANVETPTVLLWNDIDDEAPEGMQSIPKPERLDPPKPSAAHEQGMQTAERQMMMISGQWQADTGQQDTQFPASGKALNERQQQGETATYHFMEHQNDMLRFIGVQLLDLIPKIYDTERALHVLDDKNEKRWIRIDPNQADAIQKLEHVAEDEEAIQLAFNPKVGEYECVSDPGPDSATQRQEAFDAMKMMLSTNKELAAAAGDLLFKYADFLGADEIQERLGKEIKALKPYLFDDGAQPQFLALQEQNKRLVALNAELMQKLASEELRRKGREEKRDVDAFNADTQRQKVILDFLTKAMLTPQQQAELEHELTMASHDHISGLIQEANKADLAAQAEPSKSNGAGA